MDVKKWILTKKYQVRQKSSNCLYWPNWTNEFILSDFFKVQIKYLTNFVNSRGYRGAKKIVKTLKEHFENLFELGFIPVVNENDTIATTEIKYGDNDRLASRVTQITNADTLILLSDVDGLFTKNPKINKDAKLIKIVNDINKDLKEINIKGINEYGSGGMQTKIEAAKICQLAGSSMIIANGLYSNPISKIIEKNNCTWFSPKVSKLHARKKWIISSIAPKGNVVIDDGAKKALKLRKKFTSCRY